MLLGVQQLLVTSPLAQCAWQQGVGRADQHPIVRAADIPQAVQHLQTVQITTCYSLCGLLQGMLVAHAQVCLHAESALVQLLISSCNPQAEEYRHPLGVSVCNTLQQMDPDTPMEAAVRALVPPMHSGSQSVQV